MGRYIVVSDIHGNQEAFISFKNWMEERSTFDGLIILGDVIDYGPHSNQVIEGLLALDIPLVCNIRGNHEDLIISGDGSRLSSDRGRGSAKYTAKMLSEKSWDFIRNVMYPRGKYEFELQGQKCLAIHGDLSDEYWGKLGPGSNMSGYEKYDYVFSGHTHLPHMFEHYYQGDDPRYRHKRKTVFINPGSLGQPRNHCPLAQFVVIDLPAGSTEFVRLPYNIEKQQGAFSDQVDRFYRDRLELGV